MKNLNKCKLYAHIDNDKKSQFILSDLVLYQPTTNSFEVRFGSKNSKLVLFADENQAQIVHLALDDVSCKKGNLNHLAEFAFSVGDIRNVGFESLEQDGVEMRVKINKFCTTKIKKSMFDSSISKTSRYDNSSNKENVNFDNLERIEFDVDTDNENITMRKPRETADENYDESDVEEGPRFSKSRARKRSSSLISKKTPRNSTQMKLKIRRPNQTGIDTILDKKFTQMSSVMKPPTCHLSRKNFRSSFSIHASNGAKIKGDLSACGIPRPHRYSFRSTDTKSQIINSSCTVDKYSLLKNDYESLKDEIANRNTTILQLQKEIKDLKEKFATEKSELLEKFKSYKLTTEDYESYEKKISNILAENEQL